MAKTLSLQQKALRKKLGKSDLGPYAIPLRFYDFVYAKKGTWPGWLAVFACQAAFGVFVAILFRLAFGIPSNTLSNLLTAGLAIGCGLGGAFSFLVWTAVLVNITGLVTGLMMNLWIASPSWWRTAESQWSQNHAVPWSFFLGALLWVAIWIAAGRGVSILVEFIVMPKVRSGIGRLVDFAMRKDERMRAVEERKAMVTAAEMQGMRSVGEEEGKHSFFINDPRRAVSSIDTLVLSDEDEQEDDEKLSDSYFDKHLLGGIVVPPTASVETSEIEVPQSAVVQDERSSDKGVDMGGSVPVIDKSQDVGAPRSAVTNGIKDKRQNRINVRSLEAHLMIFEQQQREGKEDEYIQNSKDFLMALNDDGYEVLKTMDGGDSLIALADRVKREESMRTGSVSAIDSFMRGESDFVEGVIPSGSPVVATEPEAVPDVMSSVPVVADPTESDAMDASLGIGDSMAAALSMGLGSFGAKATSVVQDTHSKVEASSMPPADVILAEDSAVEVKADDGAVEDEVAETQEVDQEPAAERGADVDPIEEPHGESVDEPLRTPSFGGFDIDLQEPEPAIAEVSSETDGPTDAIVKTMGVVPMDASLLPSEDEIPSQDGVDGETPRDSFASQITMTDDSLADGQVTDTRKPPMIFKKPVIINFFFDVTTQLPIADRAKAIRELEMTENVKATDIVESPSLEKYLSEAQVQEVRHKFKDILAVMNEDKASVASKNISRLLEKAELFLEERHTVNRIAFNVLEGDFNKVRDDFSKVESNFREDLVSDLKRLADLVGQIKNIVVADEAATKMKAAEEANIPLRMKAIPLDNENDVARRGKGAFSKLLTSAREGGLDDLIIAKDPIDSLTPLVLSPPAGIDSPTVLELDVTAVHEDVVTASEIAPASHLRAPGESPRHGDHDYVSPQPLGSLEYRLDMAMHQAAIDVIKEDKEEEERKASEARANEERLRLENEQAAQATRDAEAARIKEIEATQARTLEASLEAERLAKENLAEEERKKSRNELEKTVLASALRRQRKGGTIPSRFNDSIIAARFLNFLDRWEDQRALSVSAMLGSEGREGMRGIALYVAEERIGKNAEEVLELIVSQLDIPSLDNVEGIIAAAEGEEEREFLSNLVSKRQAGIVASQSIHALEEEQRKKERLLLNLDSNEDLQRQLNETKDIAKSLEDERDRLKEEISNAAKESSSAALSMDLVNGQLAEALAEIAALKRQMTGQDEFLEFLQTIGQTTKVPGTFLIMTPKLSAYVCQLSLAQAPNGTVEIDGNTVVLGSLLNDVVTSLSNLSHKEVLLVVTDEKLAQYVSDYMPNNMFPMSRDVAMLKKMIGMEE